jgi:hypothetical protein
MIPKLAGGVGGTIMICDDAGVICDDAGVAAREQS